MTVVPFSDSQDHLRHELQRVRLLLSLRVHAHLALASERAQKLAGGYLDAEDVGRLLQLTADPEITHQAGQTPPPELQSQLEAAGALASTLQARRAASHAAQVPLLLDRLCQAAGLQLAERDMLLLALLADVDPNAGLLYGYLNDDLTRRHPTVHTLTGILGFTHAEALQLRQALAAHAPLVALGIVHLDPPASLPATQSVHLSAVVTQYLLEQEGLPHHLATFASLERPAVTLEQLQLTSTETARLLALVDEYARASQTAQGGVNLFLALHGQSSADHRLVAEALAYHRGTPLLTVRLAALLAQPDMDRLLRELTLYARLTGCLTFVGEVGALATAHSHLVHRWQEVMSRAAGFVILDEQPVNPPGPAMLAMLSVQLAPRGYQARLHLWEHAVQGCPLADDVNLPALANAFRLDASQVAAAVDRAKGSALWRGGAARQLTHADLQAACRHQSDSALAEQSTKIAVQRQWEDLILPEDQITQLREMCLRIKHRHTVYEAWGFGKKAGTGKGVNALFAGPSGTGKTMAAEIIAGELGQDLYRVDLSTLVSKYVGETEKNLSKVFDAAERSHAVLFFDEADAIFGKRSEVRDSHDRYANIQVAYLLQRMEAYAGVAILATNMKANTDEAFLRRLDFIVEFPFPEPDYRERIWRKLLEGDAPLGEMDYRMLAERFRLAGGVIKNAVVHAAFLAAADGRVIEMRHILRAIRREYQKLGRLMTEKELLEVQ